MYSLFNLKASIDFYFLLYLNEAEKPLPREVTSDLGFKRWKAFTWQWDMGEGKAFQARVRAQSCLTV